MRDVVHLTSADVREIPWKNGRGVTEELALWPPNSAFERGDFDWRISRASVDEPGAFSAFHGFDRILVVTEGDGLVLEHGDRARRTRLRRFEPYAFPGDWPTTAELTNGPVADFNVLVRRGVFRADIEVSNLGRRRVREALGADHAFVHALSGGGIARVTGEEEPIELGAGESVWGRDLVEGDELDFAGRKEDSVLLLVRIHAERTAES